MPTTTYTLHSDSLQFTHTTTDADEAQAWSDAGFTVTAETTNAE